MQLTIKVSEKDTKRILEIGLKPWRAVTEDEKKEYDKLVAFYGVLILNLVAQGE